MQTKTSISTLVMVVITALVPLSAVQARTLTLKSAGSSLSSVPFTAASSWHQGFVDANGDGRLNIGAGKMEFPESLLLAEPANAAHTVTFGPLNYSKEIDGVHTGVVLRAENVVDPYTKASWNETVGYFPQDSDITNDKYWSAGIFPNAPFTVNMDGECTFFMRFRWDGTFPSPGNSSAFLNAGNNAGYGFQLQINTASRYSLYSANILNKTWNGITDATLAADKWTDFAITVSNRHVTIYSIQEGDSEISTMTAEGGSGTPSGAANSEIILGHGMEGAFGWGGVATAARIRAFRGSIQSFASWNRALSADEVRQVFAWPGTDLVRLGMANDSEKEFAGGVAPTTINFNVAAKDAGLPQVLRVAATSASAAGIFNVSVNGAPAGTLSVTPGKTAALYVKKDLIVAGANTLTLTRTSADPVAIDAIALGGSIQIGNADGSFSEFASETYGGKVFDGVKSLHRGAIPYHGDNWVYNVTSGNAEFPESLEGSSASKAHLVAFNPPSEANRWFGTSGTHKGIVVRTENVVYPYARRTESTKALHFTQDTEDQGSGTYKYWTAGLHLNTNSVPFIPKFDQSGEACTFFLRFRWDGTVPIPGQRSYFLGAGDTQGMAYGFVVGLDENGHYYFYSAAPALKDRIWEEATVAANEWTDFAIVLANRKVTIYSYQESSGKLFVLTDMATGDSPASYAAENSFVIGHGRSGLADGTWTGNQSRAYGFRGSVHSFAAWNRALGEDEVRQVFAWPGERTIVNLGVVNDGNAEFGGTATASWSGITAGTVSGAVDWFNMRGTFTSSMNRLGISNFPLTADDFANGLTLRFTTTAASDTCSFDIYVNDVKAGTLSNVPGGTATLALAKNLFLVGNNKVEVRFVSSSGTVYTDAIQLVRTAGGDFRATDADLSNCAFGRYELVDGVETRQPTTMHFDVPDSIAGREGYYLRVTLNVRTAGNAQTLALSLNGAATPAAAIESAATDEFQTLTADIPATSLVAGDNALTLSNTAAQSGGSTWLGVDFVRAEVWFPTPTTIVLR